MISMEKFVAWAKQRGVIWPSSEIYGGLGSAYDYGPVGVEMKNRLKNYWWRSMVHERHDIVGQDSAIILNPKVWEASGHLNNFHDPMVEDKVTHKRYRLDELKDPKKSPDGNPVGEPKDFNLMFKTFVGPVEDSATEVYLRPETCQGIFVNFKQIYETSRQKIPFGIAQIGKAFRNEITTSNFTFRTREFEQMEMEFFVKGEKEADKWFDYWVDERMQWYIDLGIKKDNLRLQKHPKKELAHYSRATTDIEYKFPWGWGELEGIVNRGDYDLVQHQKHSGKDMTVFDEETKDKFTPWVIEPAGGVDRALLALLLDAWVEEKIESSKSRMIARTEDLVVDMPMEVDEKRIVLKIDNSLAAYDAAVFPLIKKDPLLKVAEKLVKDLRAKGKNIFYDQSGSIGRRYRRQDEIGTPVCYTIDFETLDDKKVTARDRDTMKQERVVIEDII